MLFTSIIEFRTLNHFYSSTMIVFKNPLPSELITFQMFYSQYDNLFYFVVGRLQ